MSYSYKVIHEGWLIKKSRHLDLWRERWVILTTKSLLTFKNCPWDGGEVDNDGYYDNNDDNIDETENDNDSSVSDNGSFVSNSPTSVSRNNNDNNDNENESKISAKSQLYRIKRCSKSLEDDATENIRLSSIVDFVLDHVSARFTVVTQSIQQQSAAIRMDITTAAAMAAAANNDKSKMNDSDRAHRNSQEKIDASNVKYTSFIFDAKQTSNQQLWIRQLINSMMSPKQFQTNILVDTRARKKYQISNPKCAIINPCNKNEFIIFGNNHFYDIFKYNTDNKILTQYYTFDETYKFVEKRRRSSIKQRQSSIHSRGSRGSRGSSIGGSSNNSVVSTTSMGSMGSFTNYTDVSGMTSYWQTNEMNDIDATYFGFVKFRWITQSKRFSNYLICICDTIFNIDSIYAIYNCNKNYWQSVKYGILNTEAIGKSPIFSLIQLKNEDYLFSMANCFILHVFRLDKRSQLPLSSIDMKNKKRHDMRITIQFHFGINQQPSVLFNKLKMLKPFFMIKTPNVSINDKKKNKNKSKILNTINDKLQYDIQFSLCVIHDRKVFRELSSNNKNSESNVITIRGLCENNGMPFPFSQFWDLKVAFGSDPKSHQASIWQNNHLNMGLTKLMASRMYHGNGNDMLSNVNSRKNSGNDSTMSESICEEKYADYAKFKMPLSNKTSLVSNIGVITENDLKNELRQCYIRNSVLINDQYWLFCGRFYKQNENGTIFFFNFRKNEWGLWNTMYDLEFRKFLIFVKNENSYYSKISKEMKVNDMNNGEDDNGETELCLFPRYEQLGTKFYRSLKLSKVIPSYGRQFIWNRIRVVWIAFLKNKQNNKCFFSLLDKKCILKIIWFAFNGLG